MEHAIRPSARKLILGLLLAADDHPLSAQEAISACGLFDITENNVRVTLARLVADGMVEISGRGSYRLGLSAAGVAAQVATWHDADQRLRPWQGGYVTAHVGPLGRSDRKALVRRERALSFLGLRELERDLFLRPDNLQGGVSGVRARLTALGADPEMLVFAAAEFDAQRQAALPQLWDVAALEAQYAEGRQRLESWLAHQHRLSADDAARESYLLGGAAIRCLVYDPWLPEQMIDAEARHAYVETVKRFDAAGKRIWNARSTAEFGMPIAPAAGRFHSPLDPVAASARIPVTGDSA